MRLNELRDNPGARKGRKRVGRGSGSGGVQEGASASLRVRARAHVHTVTEPGMRRDSRRSN